ncbi:MAG: ATP-binding protein, partial [Thiotrichaceae bacterium]|nr:ATP-binding protein [Thiotrichaceae bacterium]
KGSDYDFITQDYDFFFKEYPQHIIIDESQECPQIFRELRGVIDADRNQKNRFILTGSSSLTLLKGISDSLAGRVGIVEVGTLKVNELRGEGISEFYRIFEKKISGDTLLDLKSTIFQSYDSFSYLLKGGYPEPVQNKSEFAFNAWMENYHKTYIYSDVKKLFPKLNDVKYRRFISMLSSLTGTIINKAQLGRSIDTSEVTIRDYLDIVENTILWRRLPSYENNKTKSIVKMPKGHFRDTGLLHYLLNINDREQLIRSPIVGQSFESYVIEEILKGLESSLIPKWEYYYYRTRNGAEIDLILEGSFGLMPIEIKSGSSTRVKQLTALSQFIKDQELPMGIVINNSDTIKLLTNNIVQVPASCL